MVKSPRSFIVSGRNLPMCQGLIRTTGRSESAWQPILRGKVSLMNSELTDLFTLITSVNHITSDTCYFKDTPPPSQEQLKGVCIQLR